MSRLETLGIEEILFRHLTLMSQQNDEGNRTARVFKRKFQDHGKFSRDKNLISLFQRDLKSNLKIRTTPPSQFNRTLNPARDWHQPWSLYDFKLIVFINRLESTIRWHVSQSSQEFFQEKATEEIDPSERGGEERGEREREREKKRKRRIHHVARFKSPKQWRRGRSE